MKAPQQTETREATPEQLFQLLDLQLARERGQRETRSRKRGIILAFGILLIVLVGGGGLFVAQQMLQDLRTQGAGPGNPAARAAAVEK